MEFHLDANGKEPIYKQIVSQVERALRDGGLKPGEQLPSMNDLAAAYGISRETAKKAYGILTEKRLIIPRQGRGFYAADFSADVKPQVLVIFDKFSVYKQIMFNSFAEHLDGKAELTILNHNQSVELLKYYLDENLGRFDYYVIAPHFPLDEESQAMVVRQLSRIPNRKLIMIDRLQPDFDGNFGAVYQDFANDICAGLEEGLSAASTNRHLRVITMPTSLYGSIICGGVEKFSRKHGVSVEYMTEVPDSIRSGDTFLVLNSQLDVGLVALTRKIKASGLRIGADVRIISYNEYDMNELILGGLTTVSTDFPEMGRLTAEMILSRTPQKIHCPFHMNRRHTF